MKIKRILIFIFLILGLSSMIMLLIKQPNLIPPKAPKTLKDLAYDSDKRLGYTIYIPENGKLEPYLVLTKNYYKQGNVLLIRKYVLEVPLPHNKKNASSYYAGGIPDRFISEVFINEFPSKLRAQIIETSVNIRAEDVVQVGDKVEKIKRKLFLLLEKELGLAYFATSDEQEIKYFTDERYDRAIARTKDNTARVWWLRGARDHGFSNLARSVTDYVGIGASAVKDSYYLRPSFCLPPSTKIVKERIDGQYLYVLKDFQNANLSRVPLLAEDIGLTGQALEKNYEEHLYCSLKIEIENPEYGSVLSDSLTVHYGDVSQLRAVTYPNSQFDGWYLRERLISRDRNLNYEVLNGDILTAKFSKKETVLIE